MGINEFLDGVKAKREKMKKEPYTGVSMTEEGVNEGWRTVIKDLKEIEEMICDLEGADQDKEIEEMIQALEDNAQNQDIKDMIQALKDEYKSDGYYCTVTPSNIWMKLNTDMLKVLVKIYTVSKGIEKKEAVEEKLDELVEKFWEDINNAQFILEHLIQNVSNIMRVLYGSDYSEVGNQIVSLNQEVEAFAQILDGMNSKDRYNTRLFETFEWLNQKNREMLEKAERLGIGRQEAGMLDVQEESDEEYDKGSDDESLVYESGKEEGKSETQSIDSEEESEVSSDEEESEVSVTEVKVGEVREEIRTQQIPPKRISDDKSSGDEKKVRDLGRIGSRIGAGVAVAGAVATGVAMLKSEPAETFMIKNLLPKFVPQWPEAISKFYNQSWIRNILDRMWYTQIKPLFSKDFWVNIYEPPVLFVKRTADNIKLLCTTANLSKAWLSTLQGLASLGGTAIATKTGLWFARWIKRHFGVAGIFSTRDFRDEVRFSKLYKSEWDIEADSEKSLDVFKKEQELKVTKELGEEATEFARNFNYDRGNRIFWLMRRVGEGILTVLGKLPGGLGNLFETRRLNLRRVANQAILDKIINPEVSGNDEFEFLRELRAQAGYAKKPDCYRVRYDIMEKIAHIQNHDFVIGLGRETHNFGRGMKISETRRISSANLQRIYDALERRRVDLVVCKNVYNLSGSDFTGWDKFRLKWFTSLVPQSEKKRIYNKSLGLTNVDSVLQKGNRVPLKVKEIERLQALIKEVLPEVEKAEKALERGKDGGCKYFRRLSKKVDVKNLPEGWECASDSGSERATPRGLRSSSMSSQGNGYYDWLS